MAEIKGDSKHAAALLGGAQFPVQEESFDDGLDLSSAYLDQASFGRMILGYDPEEVLNAEITFVRREILGRALEHLFMEDRHASEITGVFELKEDDGFAVNWIDGTQSIISIAENGDVAIFDVSQSSTSAVSPERGTATPLTIPDDDYE